jgi:hypothetical protein
MTETVELGGGCRCGAIRYRVTQEPPRAALCHCSDCRRSAGAPAVAWMLVDEGSIEIVGEPQVYESSPGVFRSFCGRCGTGLFYRSEEIFPGQVDVQLATLDRPDGIVPKAQIQLAERIGWMERLGELPKFDRYPG